MRKTIIFFGLILSALVLVGAGCQIGPFSFGGGGAAGNDGGIFKSADKAETWVQKTQILATGGQIKNFGNINIISFVFDPSDRNAFYAGAAGNGLFYSYDAGASWQQPAQITAGAIRSIAVDPKNKCVIYLAVGNQILKSVDCNRNYVSIYQETRPDVILNQIAVDSYNTTNLFVGNSVGDLIKSSDAGKSWVVIRHFDNSVAKILMNPLDTRKMYVATQDYGIFRTGDAGKSWVDLNQGLKQYGGAFVFHDLILMDAKAESLLLSSQYGLIKSGDAGVSWTALALLTPPSGADIRVAAINPQNPQEIFYATPSTFYKSFDGGVKWTTKKLPSTRLPTVLVNDPTEPKIMYMGFLQVKK